MAIPIHFNIKRRSEMDGRKYQNEPAAGDHPQRHDRECDRAWPGDIRDRKATPTVGSTEFDSIMCGCLCPMPRKRHMRARQQR